MCNSDLDFPRLCRTGKDYLRNGGSGTSMPVMHALQPRNLTTYRFEQGTGLNGPAATIHFLLAPKISHFLSNRSLSDFGGVPPTKADSTKAPKNGFLRQSPLVW